MRNKEHDVHTQKRILVVDDKHEDLYIAREHLSASGYEVLTHPSPFGIPALISTSTPDLVLVDINMSLFPGDDLAAYLRSECRTRAMPIVAYSATNERTLVSSVAKYGLSGYICKGDNTELQRKVAYFLGSHLLDAPAFRRLLYAVE